MIEAKVQIDMDGVFNLDQPCANMEKHSATIVQVRYDINFIINRV